MLARKRHIAGLPERIRTPLLIPSFSSKSGKIGHGNVAIERHAEFISSPVLISAYDIFHNLVELPSFAEDVIFLDSGGYEALRDMQAADAGDTSGVERFKWTEDDYVKVLTDLKSRCPVVAVSFDHPQHPASLPDQLDRAERLFPKRPGLIPEFLIKTDPDTTYLNIDTLVAQVERLATYPIVGLTDKELGVTMMERLLCVARLRVALDNLGSDIPIHIFGSLDPITAPLYFLAGADVFDGLAWLRYGFSDGLAVYPQNYEAVKLDLHRRQNGGAQLAMWSRNYHYLVLLEDEMRRFLRKYDFESFSYNADLLKNAWGSLDESLKD
jgi:hypothetical protein